VDYRFLVSGIMFLMFGVLGLIIGLVTLQAPAIVCGIGVSAGGAAAVAGRKATGKRGALVAALALLLIFGSVGLAAVLD
jgi:hypothetical protein